MPPFPATTMTHPHGCLRLEVEGPQDLIHKKETRDEGNGPQGDAKESQPWGRVTVRGNPASEGSLRVCKRSGLKGF